MDGGAGRLRLSTMARPQQALRFVFDPRQCSSLSSARLV